MVSCQDGCKSGQKVYTDMMENMFKPNKDITKDKKWYRRAIIFFS